jgi:hypothetical protein
LTEDDRWRRTEPPSRGPSAPRDLRFNPLATAIGVFAAVAIPIVVVGYTRPAGANGTIIVSGVVAGVVAGFLAGLWVARRGGRVWRGPRL